MKALVISDIHLDAITAGKPRLEEVLAYLRNALEFAVAERIELVIFAGDAFDPGSLLESVYTAHFTRAMFEFVRNGMTVVAIPGNHDVIDSSEMIMREPVTTLTPLRIAALYSHYEDQIFVCEKPTSLILGESPAWAVLALPYVSRVHANVRADWMGEAIAAARDFRARGGRLIVVGHLMIAGAVLGSESVEFARGQDQPFPYKLVKELEPAVVINGHYHGRQEVLAEHDLLIQIPGSPLRFTFGEVEDRTKGYLTVNFS